MGVVDKPIAAPEKPAARRSLVDDAERAVRAWLAPGRYRAGDRLPPEHELAAMLGVSRGTLRSALERLELSGEIVRRQGSGTFVARTPAAAALGDQLQRLEPCSAVARRQGVALTVANLRISHPPVDEPSAGALRLQRGTRTTLVTRTLLASNTRVGVMYDVLHPDVPLPADRALAAALHDGQSLLDVLSAADVAVSFARTTINPALVRPCDDLGQRLRLCVTTACLELEETIYAAPESPVLYSRDVYAPDGIGVEVVRSVDAPRPGPVGAPR